MSQHKGEIQQMAQQFGFTIGPDGTPIPVTVQPPTHVPVTVDPPKTEPVVTKPPAKDPRDAELAKLKCQLRGGDDCDGPLTEEQKRDKEIERLKKELAEGLLMMI